MALRRPRGDAGFGLVELMMACVILMIVASAIVGVLTSALKTTRVDKARVAAANLASREISIVRSFFESGDAKAQTLIAAAGTPQVNTNPLPGGAADQPLVVNGIPYTVSYLVTEQFSGSGPSLCDGGTAVLHPSYALHVSVTWPNMQGVNPVVSDTLLTPGKNIVDDSSHYGFFAVKVTDRATAPVSGLSVQVSGPTSVTATTDASGCAVAALTTPGSYTATLNTAGNVDFYGNPTPSVSADVQIGELDRMAIRYDKAATLRVAFTTAPGYALPSQLPMIALGNSGLQPTGKVARAATGATTAVSGLWPFPSGYSVWAGSCDDADPAVAPTATQRPTAVVPVPGGLVNATATLAPIDVLVTNSYGIPLGNVLVTAVKPADIAGASSGCDPSDSSLQLGMTNASGYLATSIPYGNWQLSAGGGYSDDFAPSATGSTGVQVVTP